MGLVIDTSILIATERKRFALEEFILSMENETFFMSSITLSELWHGCHRGKGPKLAERIQHIKSLEAKVPVLGFGTEEALFTQESGQDLKTSAKGSACMI